MSKKNHDIVDVIALLQDKILNHKPSMETMWAEVCMMKFKIRPVMGDISSLNFHNNNLIELMWSLGKLDDFFHQEYKKLSNSQKDIFFKIFEDLHEQFQSELNALNLNRNVADSVNPSLEMEIFKEHTPKSKIN